MPPSPTSTIEGTVHDEQWICSTDAAMRGDTHVLRILSGAQVIPSYRADERVGLIVLDGVKYVVSAAHLGLYQNAAECVRRGYLGPNGIHPPFAPEAVATILQSARFALQNETEIPPDTVRVLFLLKDTQGCGFYRAMQPVLHLNLLGEQGGAVHAERSPSVTPTLAGAFDVIVAARESDPNVIGILQRAQASGVVVLYETDDLLSDIPETNPARSLMCTPTEVAKRHFLKDISDGLIVSTPQLKDALGFAGKTRVLRNAIDLELWARPDQPRDDDVVRILWQGSPTHEADLDLVVRPLQDLFKRFGPRVQMTLWGHIPTRFTEPRKQTQSYVLSQKVAKNVSTMPMCDVWSFPQTYCQIQADISIAPLVDCPFNRSKSELKVIEAWAAGCAVVASPVAPYSRAISDNQNGLIARDPQHWFRQLCRLVESPPERERLAAGGFETLTQQYLIQNAALDYERALLSFCDGRIERPGVQKRIEDRLEELNSD